MPKPRKKPRPLELLRLDRVSLVDKGDNPEAHILIHKRADEDDVEKAIQRGRSMQRMCSDVEKAVQSKWGDEGWAYCKETYADAVVFEQGGKQWLAPYTMEESEGEMKISLGDREQAETVYETTKGESMTAEQITQKFTALEGTLAETNTALAETKKRAERSEGILKLTTEERAVFEKLTAEQQDQYLAGDTTVRKSFVPAKTEPTEIEKRLAAAEDRERALAKRVADAEERAELAEFTKRAETEYPNTPGKPEEKGRMLRDIEKLAEPARTAALAALKAGDAALATLSKSAGYIGRETADDAESKIEKAAAEIMATQKVSKSEAIKQAMAKHAEEYASRRDEISKGVN